MAGEKDRLLAAHAANRDISAKPPGARQDCADVVNIAVFFDGTGNNKDIDEPLKRWSNVARLWRSASLSAELSKAIYPIYVSGVGTPFNGTATDWLDSALMTAEDKAAGSIGGAGGTRRTEFGRDNVNETLRQVLVEGAKKLDAATKAYAEKSEDASLADLSKALSEHRLIRMINLSIFGFSRGAALARAFSNDFLRDCVKDKAGKLTYRGWPIRLHFMGLFDTVASFGVPTANMDALFTEKNLRVPGEVERCVHYVAAHELRFSFPVDLIRRHGQLMPNWTETVYPGVHSDVGGGYEPVEQGRPNQYARIPLRDMMREAVKAGVRLMDYHDMKTINAPVFKERFAITPEAQLACDRYIRAVPTQGSVEQQVDAHMKALYSAYGTMYRQGIGTPDRNANAGQRLVGHASMAREVQALRSRLSAAGLLAEEAYTQAGLQFIGTAYGQIVKPQAWRLNAWDTAASDDLLGLIGRYVHDSKAGFLYGAEPFSYFRPRAITESSRNVLATGLAWLEASAEAVAQNVMKVYATSKGVVVETWLAAHLIATRTYAVGERVVLDTVEAGQKYAVEVYQTSTKVVLSAFDQGRRVIIDSVDVAQKEAAGAFDAVTRKVGALVDSAGKTISDGMLAVDQRWQSTKAALGI